MMSYKKLCQGQHAAYELMLSAVNVDLHAQSKAVWVCLTCLALRLRHNVDFTSRLKRLFRSYSKSLWKEHCIILLLAVQQAHA